MGMSPWETHHKKPLMPLVMAGAAVVLMIGYFQPDPYQAVLDVPKVTATPTKYLATLPENDCQINGAFKECKWVFLDENGSKWWVFQRHPLQ